jgi:zinc protease
MIHFEKFYLDNGLTVIVHEDRSTPMAVVNVMYNVGAKDEDPNKTGFAHLFEHLMFGGSKNIPDYDEPLQRAGGDNNAYTTNDLTNYYCSLPAQNIETAFWLESDRMLSLAFSKKSLEVQRKVVCEEFKEHYINKPYGDVWFKMRELAYKEHPYKWMTIGKELSHVENATIDDVKAFFNKHYTPCNAILVVAGNVTVEHVKQLANKWFATIPSGNKYNRNLPTEPPREGARKLEHTANVPLHAFVKTWHIDARLHKGYYVADVLSEVLGGGGSSRLHQQLVKEQRLFSNIECYHFGSIEKGLLAIDGKLVKGVSMQEANNAVNTIINELKVNAIAEDEMKKVINKTESVLAFEDMSIASRAASLANYELLGNAALINEEFTNYNRLTIDDISTYSKLIFAEENSNTLHYYSNN